MKGKFLNPHYKNHLVIHGYNIRDIIIIIISNKENIILFDGLSRVDNITNHQNKKKSRIHSTQEI